MKPKIIWVSVLAAIAVLLCLGAVWSPDNNVPEPNDPGDRALQKINSILYQVTNGLGQLNTSATFSGTVNTLTNVTIIDGTNAYKLVVNSDGSINAKLVGSATNVTALVTNNAGGPIFITITTNGIGSAANTPLFTSDTITGGQGTNVSALVVGGSGTNVSALVVGGQGTNVSALVVGGAGTNVSALVVGGAGTNVSALVVGGSGTNVSSLVVGGQGTNVSALIVGGAGTNVSALVVGGQGTNVSALIVGGQGTNVTAAQGGTWNVNNVTSIVNTVTVQATGSPFSTNKISTFQAFFKTTPTVTASAYAAANCVGTFTTNTFFRLAGSTGGINQVDVVDWGNQKANLDFLFFSQKPAAGTYTDKSNAQYSSDLQYYIGHASITNYIALNATNALGTYIGPSISVTNTENTTSIYVLVLTQGTPTPSSTTNYTFYVRGYCD